MVSNAGVEVTIRRVSPEDSAAVAELSAQLGYPASAEEVHQRILKVGTHGRQAVFVACVAQEVVGWIEGAVVSHLQSPVHTLIGGLVVKDGARGLGIGRRLCEEIETWSREQGVALIRVTSRSTREDAHRFYLRDGYAEVKTSRVFEKKLV